MPASTGQDGRVRSPFTFQERLEQLHLNETPARCKSACCSPLRPREEHDHVQPNTRPALNRSAASHQSTKSVYSTGTDGSSHAQSDDPALPEELSDCIDLSTFEQVRRVDANDKELVLT